MEVVYSEAEWEVPDRTMEIDRFKCKFSAMRKKCLMNEKEKNNFDIVGLTSVWKVPIKVTELY